MDQQEGKYILYHPQHMTEDVYTGFSSNYKFCGGFGYEEVCLPIYMKVQKVYQSQILGNPTQCLLRHSQPTKKCKRQNHLGAALRTRGGRLKSSFVLEDKRALYKHMP